jgi:NAD(P)-dependent dehydrogenase (short-subunit alcohol dehydrogenase family)
MTRDSLAGRSAVITGGGRGLGAAIARSLADHGAKVMVAARTPEELDRVVDEVRARGGDAWRALCDVTDEGSVRSLGDSARDRFGAVDILVNNAGASASAPLQRITLEEWDRMLAVNATSTFLCTREFVPGMVERRWGRVVNIASTAGLTGSRYIAHYSASKHAVLGFTRSVALELLGSGVTVNAVCPGYADTPMTERTLASVAARTGKSHADALAAVLGSAGQERLISPAEVADAVLALCGDTAGKTTGEAVVLNAGARAS